VLPEAEPTAATVDGLPRRVVKAIAAARWALAFGEGVNGVSEDIEPVYYSDGVAPVSRASADQVFFLIIEARPESDSDDFGKAGGAFVNCWVNVDNLRSAERRAVALILDYGWRPYRFEEWKLVTRATYAGLEPREDGEPDLSEVLDQAFVDGEVSIFNTWPVDAPDANEE
jgi:hypothetical protein